MANIGAFFKKTLPNMALTVAAGVPGPIGMVATMIGGILGKTIQPAPEAINTAVEGATPDKLVELQEKDIEFKELNAKLGIDEELVQARLAEQDRESARQREEVVKDKTPRNLAYLTVLTGFGVAVVSIYLAAKPSLPAAAMGMIGTVVGLVFRDMATVYNYFFGSSSGSDRKTELLAQANGGGS